MIDETVVQTLMQQIAAHVKARGPVRAIELISQAAVFAHRLGIVDIVSFDVLDRMVEEKQLEAVVYVDPLMDYREKTLYFPIGSIVSVHK
jgi:hypothetical protein